MLVEQHDFNALKAVTRAPRLTPRTPAAERLRVRAIELAETEGLGLASYAYRVASIEDVGDGHLRIEDETLFAPWLVPESGTLTSIGIGLATLGPRLEQRVTALFGERQAALALALAQLGTELLFATSARLEVRLRASARRDHLSVSGELHPGDPGLALAAQQSVLRLMSPATLGIRLHNGHLFHPLKSISVIFGIGIDLPPAQWSRCDLCPSRAKCSKADAKVSA
jgi:hypothetical protein